MWAYGILLASAGVAVTKIFGASSFPVLPPPLMAPDASIVVPAPAADIVKLWDDAEFGKS